MTILIVGLILFLGTHSIRIVAEPLRARLVGSMGEGAYKGLYSLLALAGLVLIVIGYGQARMEPVVLYQPPTFLRHMNMLLMLIVFPALLASHLPGRVQSALKHPLLVAVKAWALGHLLVNGMLADVLLFGGFLAWAVVDRISIKRRSTPSRSPQLPAGRFNDPIVIVGGLGLYVAFAFWLHPILIGVPAVG
ncbi:NnrU family protein [Wenzhouxiangella marina]|uniref:Protein NnrU n=1 Tax=Wenzhouxiangella marina TaxID=1579979 RepID=A0A0K0XXR7_9GAMM|nr:NnrU family protein [Wenzhouxiangella marina]AKS42470.1 Protein NnrU [Wenzhouxiangella marina]MBB6085755.1 putative membrane protein [Wenzhouxiangella marina]